MTTKTERIPVMFDKRFVDRIDEYGFSNRIQTRAEAIRQLIAVGLESDQRKTEKGTEAAA